MTPEELDQAIRAGQLEPMLALLEGATEAERRAAAPTALAARAQVRAHWEAHNGGRGKLMDDPAEAERMRETASVAIYGTGTKADIDRVMVPDEDAVYRLLSARRPEWLSRWAEEQVKRYRWYWPLMRKLEKAGLVERPDCDEYTIAMIVFGYREGAYKLLQEDPEMIEREVPRLFEVEGDRDGSLASNDKFRSIDNWAQSLARLAEEGRLSRDWLLDASLDALERDFEQFRAGWFSRFHEFLSPTLEEREARRERYLGLLGSRIPPTGSFALKALLVLDKAGKLPAQDAAGLAPILGAREKGTVTSALKLLDRAATRDPGVKQRAAETAVEALLHAAPEVQEAALALIEKHGDAAKTHLRRLLEERLSDVAASLKPRLTKLLGSETQQSRPEPEPEADAADLSDLVTRAGRIPQHFRTVAGIDAVIDDAQAGALRAPALELPFHAVPQLDPGTAIAPIETLDELIDAFGPILENYGPPEEIERALDGLSRLCDQRPDDFDRRVGPLRKRAAKLFRAEEWAETWLGWPEQDLPALVLAWTDGKVQKLKKHKDPDLTCFTGLRLYELARRVAERRPRALLAFPTHRPGWIDPRTLICRPVEGAEPADAIQALLRLAPDHRPEALAAASGLEGEVGDAIRHALGAQGVKIGPTAELWAAAARARSPREDDPAVDARHPGMLKEVRYGLKKSADAAAEAGHPDMGPDTGRAARIGFSVEHETRVYDGTTYHYYNPRFDLAPPVPKKLNPWFPMVMHHHPVEEQTPSRQWCAAIWPGGRHAWFALGIGAVGNNLDWWEAEWQNRVYLEALLGPDTDLGELGVLLLAMGLGAKEATESALSVDALLLATADGRVTAENLGAAMARLAVTGMIKPARWAKSLAVAARSGTLPMEVVRRALERVLAAAPEMRPVDAGAIFGLIHELCIESGGAITDPQARAFLEGVTSGKAGKAAKALLTVSEGDRSAALHAAAAAALRGRIERAERWIAWGAGE